MLAVGVILCWVGSEHINNGFGRIYHGQDVDCRLTSVWCAWGYPATGAVLRNEPRAVVGNDGVSRTARRGNGEEEDHQ